MVVVLDEVLVAHAWLFLDEYSCFDYFAEAGGICVACFEYHCDCYIAPDGVGVKTMSRREADLECA